MNKNNKIQLSLLSFAVFLVLFTYFLYPLIDKKKSAKKQEILKYETDIDKTSEENNKYIAEWAGSKLKKSEEEKKKYIQEIIEADQKELGNDDVFEKIKKDFKTALVDIDDLEIKNQIKIGLNFAKDHDDKINNKISNQFTKLRYEGLYNIDRPFIVEAENARVLKENPDIILMKKMQVILKTGNGKVWIITSDQGSYNKVTYDCFFENNVKATDSETLINADNLDLLSSEDSAVAYENVNLTNDNGSLQADKINYDFENKVYNVSMRSTNEKVKAKIIR